MHTPSEIGLDKTPVLGGRSQWDDHPHPPHKDVSQYRTVNIRKSVHYEVEGGFTLLLAVVALCQRYLRMILDTKLQLSEALQAVNPVSTDWGRYPMMAFRVCSLMKGYWAASITSKSSKNKGI